MQGLTKLLVLFFIGIICCSFQSAKVYICLSAGSYAYHFTMDCRGIKQCKHDIKAVTLSEAISLGRKPCGWEK